MSIRLPIVTLSTVAFCARLTVFGAQASTWVCFYSKQFFFAVMHTWILIVADTYQQTATPELFTTSDRGTGHAVANSMARVVRGYVPSNASGEDLCDIHSINIGRFFCSILGRGPQCARRCCWEYFSVCQCHCNYCDITITRNIG